jgi:hypothetical protein
MSTYLYKVGGIPAWNCPSGAQGLPPSRKSLISTTKNNLTGHDLSRNPCVSGSMREKAGVSLWVYLLITPALAHAVLKKTT